MAFYQWFVIIVRTDDGAHGEIVAEEYVETLLYYIRKDLDVTQIEVYEIPEHDAVRALGE